MNIPDSCLLSLISVFSTPIFVYHNFVISKYNKLDCSRWYTIANTHFFTFDLDLGVMVTQSVAEYPPHRVIHGPGKFEVAISDY